MKDIDIECVTDDYICQYDVQIVEKMFGGNWILGGASQNKNKIEYGTWETARGRHLLFFPLVALQLTIWLDQAINDLLMSVREWIRP